VVGIPDIALVEGPNLSPGGSFPPVTFHPWGCVPPLVLISTRQFDPTVTLGNEEVVIVSGVWARDAVHATNKLQNTSNVRRRSFTGIVPTL
jgi:hypothetical protein